MRDGTEAKDRAAQLRQRISAAGLTIAEFQRKSGLTRNVVYALAKGKKPTQEQQAAIDGTLPK